MKNYVAIPGLVGVATVLAGTLAPLPAANASPAASVAAKVMSATTVTNPLVTGATCRYLNSAAAAPSGWKSQTFADTAWNTGVTPIGHEDSAQTASTEPAPKTDIKKPAKTSYYRCGFTVDPAGASTVTVSARVDDGAVVYLNGTEIGRQYMPSGTIAHNTTASLIDPYDGQKWVTWQVSKDLLKTGANVLAIEVHQLFTSNWTSADSMMDAKVSVTKPSSSTTVATPTGWKLYFADEFSSPTLNTSSWKAYNNTYGDGDPDIVSCLTPKNVSITGGSLKLTAKKEKVTCANGKARDYTSGFLGSRDVGKFYPLYGRYETRARTPNGQGMFPAFWLRHKGGSGAAEVDIYELFHSSRPNDAMQTLHFPQSIGYNVAKKSTWQENVTTPGRGEWHTYGVDITQVTPGSDAAVKFSFDVDGVKTFSYVNTKTSTWTTVDKNAAWDIALQLWVGGKWVGDPDKNLGWLPAGHCALNGAKPAGNDPANCPKSNIWLAPWSDPVFEIDYVRVYTPSA